MLSTHGHGPKRVVLYARVSTDEQPSSGYSLAQQLEALREYASREGYEVLEEVQDPGQSGASLERPGMDHVRDLVAAGGISAFEELKQLISPELAKCLDPSASYGAWWFNRRRRHRTRVAENGPDGKSYRWRSATVLKPRGEWIAVPVPDSGIPREWVDAAREAIRDNRRPSSNGRRFWELSGRILFLRWLRTERDDRGRTGQRRALRAALFLLPLPLLPQRRKQRLRAGEELPGRRGRGAGMGGDLPLVYRLGKAPRRSGEDDRFGAGRDAR